MSKEQIIEKLLKIKALSENGKAGERDNAQKLLTSLMRKYHISPEELDSEEIEFHLAFTGNGDYDFKLFMQLLAHMYEGKKKPRMADLRKAPKADLKAWYQCGLGPANSNVGVECTKAEFIEIITLFEIYKEDFHKQAEIFYTAYLHKNKLLISRDEEDDPTEEELKEAFYAKLMSRGIQKKQIHKLIEN